MCLSALASLKGIAAKSDVIVQVCTVQVLLIAKPCIHLILGEGGRLVLLGSTVQCDLVTAMSV